MATGYANCILGSDGCDDLQHILKRPRTIQSVMRIAPVIKTPITNSSIFGCLCAFLDFFVPFCLFFCLFGYLCLFSDVSSFHSLAIFHRLLDCCFECMPQFLRILLLIAYSYKTCLLLQNLLSHANCLLFCRDCLDRPMGREGDKMIRGFPHFLQS